MSRRSLGKGEVVSRFIRAICAALVVGCLTISATADDSERLLTIDHYIRAAAAPAPAGTAPQLYLRERAKAGVVTRGGVPANRVVLFVHGAGTPAEVSFDVPHGDYSWMAYLAQAGYDVFSVDMTGYGRSWRPAAMNDPCNIPASRQAEFVPSLLPKPCAPSSDRHATTIASDWADIGTAVDYVRALRRVDQVSLIAWSLGGPRAGGYAAQNPAKVRRLVLLAPAYNRTRAAEPPADVPAKGEPFTIQSRTDLVTLWDSQVGCADQYDTATLDSIWSEMMASDPVGATWGTGVRRAPNLTQWGWNQAVVAKQRTPALLVAGAHDRQVPPDRVRELYADYGGTDKVFVDLACSGHNAMWERNRLLLFKASLEWLEKGTVTGKSSGELRLGY
jgi:pimeloyl-ACP methyl ester carboxylesterase